MRVVGNDPERIAEREKRRNPADCGQIRRKKCARVGSVARGEAGPESDIDFLVEMEPDRSLFDLGGLLMDLQELLGVDVDIVTVDALRLRIKDQVLREAVAR